MGAAVLYEAPLMLEKSRFSWIVCRELGINAGPCEMTEWEAMVDRIKARKECVRIAIVGKYVKLHDAYLSVAEALKHGGYENGCHIDIKWVEAEDVNGDSVSQLLGDVDGILVPRHDGHRPQPYPSGGAISSLPQRCQYQYQQQNAGYEYG